MYRKLIKIEHQNRWADCVFSNGEILFEIDNFSKEFVDKLLEASERETSVWYEKGIKEGVKIATDVYRKS